MEISFDALAAGGDAVGRDQNGRAVFVPRAAPGDRSEVEITREKKSFASGRVVRLLEPSPLRIAAPCRYFDSGDIATSCGGCTWQHLAAAEQLRAKRAIVRDALLRIGGIEDAEERVGECVPSPQAFHYRNKGDFVAARDGEAFALGFFAPDSHRLVDIAACPIQQNTNNAILAAAREAVAQGLAEPFDSATGRGVLRRLVARVASNGDAMACAVTTKAPWPKETEFASFLRARVPDLLGVLRRQPQSEAHLIADGSGTERDWLVETVDGLSLRVHGEGFFQINTFLVNGLLQTALGMAAVRPGEKVLDLFCGVGLFSLGMARQGAEVVGVERSKQAIRDATENARANSLKARFIDGDSATVLRRLRERGCASCDCVLLDPPRAGAAEVLPELAKLQPARIVYVSCDPATLARDAKQLREAGYGLERAAPLDLFPQTAHVETAALFNRTG